MNTIINHFHQSLPNVLQWIEAYRALHASKQSRLIETPFEGLKRCFTTSMLERASSVPVDVVEMPPLSKLGLPEFQNFESTNYAGVTYLSTYYLQKSQAKDESLNFHEMVHVIQWDELGAEGFLLLYAIGLAQNGYRHSPLEEIAYYLQSEFEAGRLIDNQELRIRQHARSLIRGSEALS